MLFTITFMCDVKPSDLSKTTAIIFHIPKKMCLKVSKTAWVNERRSALVQHPHITAVKEKGIMNLSETFVQGQITKE